MQLQKHKGVAVTNKLDDLAAYDNVKDEAEHIKALMDSKDITAENFAGAIQIRSARGRWLKCSTLLDYPIFPIIEILRIIGPDPLRPAS